MGTYHATGSSDTFAWSTEIFSGDITLSVDVESNRDNGEAVVVVYGDGAAWSHGCLIFNIANDFCGIRAHSIYHGGQFLVSGSGVKFRNRAHNMTIRITEDQATLRVDGAKTLSAKLPEGIGRRGRIALFKYSGRPDVTFSNVKICQADCR